jgi:peptidoglycan-associated lipoprotein
MKIDRLSLTVILALALATGAAGLGCHKKGPVASGESTGEEITLEMIHFDFDKYNIKQKFQAVLERHAQWIKDNPSINITIQGNTDEWGTEEYNLALGERRAVAAKNYLVNLGVSPDRLSTISYGETRPIDPAHTPAAWAMNRRDEFKGRK